MEIATEAVNAVQPWWHEIAIMVVAFIIRHFEKKKYTDKITSLTNKLNGTP